MRHTEQVRHNEAVHHNEACSHRERRVHHNEAWHHRERPVHEDQPLGHGVQHLRVKVRARQDVKGRTRIRIHLPRPSVQQLQLESADLFRLRFVLVFRVGLGWI